MWSRLHATAFSRKQEHSTGVGRSLHLICGIKRFLTLAAHMYGTWLWFGTGAGTHGLDELCSDQAQSGGHSAVVVLGRADQFCAQGLHHALLHLRMQTHVFAFYAFAFIVHCRLQISPFFSKNVI